MDRARALLSKLLPLKFGIAFPLLVISQTVWFTIIHITGTHALELNAKNVMLLLYSFLTLAIVYQLFNTVFSWARPLHVLGKLFLVFVSIGFSGYHHTTKASFEYSVAADNIANAFTSEGGSFVVKACGVPSMVIGGVTVVGLLLLEIKWRMLSTVQQRAPQWPKALTSVLLFTGVMVAPWTTYDDFTYFWKSGFEYYVPGSRHDTGYKPGTFPLVRNQGKTVASVAKETPQRRPPIILLTVESFNAEYVERRGPGGKAHTPFFDNKLKEGIYVENFYANSVQTCKGLYAILFSTVPSIRRKVFTDYHHLRGQSLPTILRKAGYETIYYQAYDDLKFDRTDEFMQAHGYDLVKSVYELLSAEEKAAVWGWGPEDAVFYRRFFEWLDQHHATRAAKNKPFFIHLITIANHLHFDEVPVAKRALYKRQKTHAEGFANSIHLTDSQLAVFFEEVRRRPHFKEALIIITGDHAVPVGTHDIVHNEVGFYDDSFRVPLLMIWDGHLPPRRISNKAFSQMDIAPTVLDLLGLSGVEHHFQGVSMLDKTKGRHPIFLVQPYSGRYLGVVRWPHKYVFHERTRNEFVYDVAKDSLERENLIDTTSSATLQQLRDDVRYFYTNQKLLEHDQIWPGD